MSMAADITLLRPLWLLALPVLLILGWLLDRRRSELGDWQKGIDPHLLQAMTRLGRVDRSAGKSPLRYPLWVAALICIALSGPAIQRGTGQSFRNLDGVILVIDVSGSMTRDASWPATVAMARASLTGLGGKPAALIVYAGDSYRAATLTTDHLQLGQTIALLDDKTVPDRGNRPALALRDAARLLSGNRILAGDVVLFTDGAGLEPEALAAARSIAAQGARLAVVHAPTTPTTQEVATLAEIERLAGLGEGAVFALDQPTDLIAYLGSGGAERLERQAFRFLFWTDYGRYLLVLALIPAALLFRREAV